MSIRIKSISIVFWFLVAAGCAHYPVNPELDTVNLDDGYRYHVVRREHDPEKPFVILAFSGGGTRAAAFSFGLLQELDRIFYTVDGQARALLDDVEIISSVSGGSFTAAYYALFRDRFFKEFPEKMLYQNIEKDLILSLFNPYNWGRLAAPDFSRIDLAAEYYHKKIFQEQTFGDLLKRPRGSVPFMLLNATDISIAHRFEFTQDQFDLLCSDLNRVSIARGVAASSDFPVAFTPLTLKNYGMTNCGTLPGWIKNGLSDKQDNGRRKIDAKAAASYREKQRPYCHLLDGGLSDNLGLRGPYNAITTTDAAWSLVTQENLGRIKQLMVIAANAKTSKQHKWDETAKPPGITDVLGVVTGGPMDDVSLDSVEMMREHFENMTQLAQTVRSCNSLLETCPGQSTVPVPISSSFSFTELAFDYVKEPCIRRYLQELPTSFNLDRTAIRALSIAAAQLLNQSEAFLNGMKKLDPGWTPRTVVFPQDLKNKICTPQ
ncbi:MAG: patatin-like phospholipase family protein [Proteobacteria bacterium]|nr:patatin-like phospholipase family protein [Pseudomonadota bacterium]